MDGLRVSASTASLLTMAPVFCLGLFGFVTPALTQRFGRERVIFVALVVLIIGIGLRGIPSFASLFVSTVFAGAGIGVAGVLMPAAVKDRFPLHAGRVTGFYTMGLCLGASLAAGLTVPLAQWLGGWWRGLAVWTVPALVAAAIWWPYLGQAPAASSARALRHQGFWRNALAWQVTIFMGLQSSLAYIVFGWLAPILRDRGFDAVAAGWAVSLSVLVQAPAALCVPVILSRRSSQSGAIVLFVFLTMFSLLGTLFAPSATVWLWVVILGVAQGSCFSIALSLLALRARDASGATELSSMAQSVGYTLAAMGPLLTGLIHDWSGSWGPTGFLFVAICIGAAVAGYGAGRDRFVEP